MQRVKTVRAKFGRLDRYKCTCGHSLDLAPESAPPDQEPAAVLIEDGFHEFPEEVWENPGTLME